MFMRRIQPLFVFLLLFVFTAIACAAPKNVILFIGDGMGHAHIAAARISTLGQGGRLTIEKMPVTGMHTTHSANALVTDSAAGATALACGVKTNNYTVSKSPDGRRVRSILEASRTIGKATGVVTTTSVTDATPAAFTSHVDERGMQPEIAGQQLDVNIDVLMGGGRAYFLPEGDDGYRSDSRNLLSEAAAKGYIVVGTAEELNKVNSGRVLGLFAMEKLTTQSPEPSLSEMTKKAIQILSQDTDGFFLMVEGGQIDSYAHRNDLDGMVRQLIEFDKAVAEGLSFAQQNGDTLVVVTADHETGGLTLLSDDEGNLEPSWSTGGHSGIMVPVFAFGPESQRFTGLMDNTDISKKIGAVWGVKVGLFDVSDDDKTADSVRIKHEYSKSAVVAASSTR